MITTITLGNYISIQGTFMRDRPDGTRVVRVGRMEFIGRPVKREIRAA